MVSTPFVLTITIAAVLLASANADDKRKNKIPTETICKVRLRHLWQRARPFFGLF